MRSQKYLIILGGILFLSLALRTYKLTSNLHFTGDEGRDAIIAREIINGKIPIVGPASSVGEINLGPLYYYLIAPFALLGENPVYLAIPVVVFSVLTSALLYFVTDEVFGDRRAGILAALTYAIYPTTVVYGRFSWNPNIMPFFALLLFYSLWKITVSGNWRWLFLTAFSFGVSLQSHYASLAVTPVILAVLWKKRKSFLKWWQFALPLTLFCLMLSPLIVYDLVTNFRNLRGLLSLAGGSSGFRIETHYFGVFWPVIFMVVSLVLSKLMRVGLAGRVLLAFLLTLTVLSALSVITQKAEPSVSGVGEVVSLVQSKSDGRPFNFAVLSEVNREDSYKYFFITYKDQVRFSTPTEQLFVVCEGDVLCTPQGHPKYEIAIFEVAYDGQVEVVDEWSLNNYYHILHIKPRIMPNEE